MQRLMKSLLVPAVLAVAPFGCMTSDEPAPHQRPGMEEGVYRRTNYTPPTPPESVAKDIPLYGSNGPVESPPPVPAAAADDGPPPVDSTGIKLGELPSVQRATINPRHWQRAATEIEAGIDAPELKRNVREGMATLAPRVARALIDFKGETAIVTVAVYRDTSPTTRPVAATQPAGDAATRPSTQPATQPTYNHAAVAIAFEGFVGQLDPSFIPRVLADQPRTPDDGREPIDFNLAVDRNATTYVFYRLTNDGLMAGEVSHDELRRELAAAAEKATPSTTTRAAVEAPRANDVAGEYVPVPSGGGGAIYDSGEPWTGYDYNNYDYGSSYRYGSGPSYYGGVSDPYLYDLYRCNWDSPYYVSRSGLYFDDYSYYGSGFYYGGGGYYSRHRHHHHDRHDRHDDHPNRPRDNDRPSIVISDRSPRGQVPWSNPPLVSRTNPPANGNRGGTPLVIPAQPKPAVVTPPAARPAPTITGRPMPQPKEFVGPRALDRTGNTAAAGGGGNARVVRPNVSDNSSGKAEAKAPAPEPKPVPIIVPTRQPTTPYVAPPPRPVAPPIQRPSNRGSSAAERINSAPRLGPASNGNREFVGPRSNAGGGSRSAPSNARSITGGGDSGGGRSAASAANGGGRSGGGNAGSRGGGGGGDGGGRSGSGDGGGRSGNGGRDR